MTASFHTVKAHQKYSYGDYESQQIHLRIQRSTHGASTLPVRSIGRSELYRNLSAVVAYGLFCTCDGYLEGTDFLHSLEAAGSLAYGQLAG